MAEIKKYFIIDLPYVDIVHVYDIDMNSKGVHKKCIDKSKVIIKTTQTLINKKVNKGIPYTTIFPVGQTVELTYDDIREIVQTADWYEFINL